MRKFRAAKFGGDIAWLQGGIQSLWRDNRHLLDGDPVSDDEEEPEGSALLRARGLPQSAFQQSSTIVIHGSPSHTKKALPLCLSMVVTDKGAGSDTTKSDDQQRITAANPFYDNIRQNIELSQGITERIPLRLSPTTSSRVREIPFAWLRSIARAAGQDECTEALAMQFYRIELGEQRRLQGIMAHHSSQSDAKSEARTEVQDRAKNDRDQLAFPYSIIAGVEKGEKNRFVIRVFHSFTYIDTY